MTAFALMLWYCVSIIGFDVHTCNGSGRSFVATFIDGLSCEDIHSGHSHDCCGLVHEHELPCCSDDHHCPRCGGEKIMATPCCTSDYQVLALTGVIADDFHRHYDECACGNCPCIAVLFPEVPVMMAVSEFLKTNPHLHKADIMAGHSLQAALSVWRI